MTVYLSALVAEQLAPSQEPPLSIVKSVGGDVCRVAEPVLRHRRVRLPDTGLDLFLEAGRSSRLSGGPGTTVQRGCWARLLSRKLPVTVYLSALVAEQLAPSQEPPLSIVKSVWPVTSVGLPNRSFVTAV